MTNPALTFHPVNEQDLPFLLNLRKATMTEHLIRAGAPTDDAHHLARIRHRWDDAQIVRREGLAIGLLKVSREPQSWRVVQIQIAPELQGQGLGRRILSAVLDQADAVALPVTLSVLKGSPAQRLYLSLGFVVIGTTELEHEMRYSGADAAAET